MELIIDSSRGIYAPQEFVRKMDMSSENEYHCDIADITIVEQGPEHPEYWDAWDDIVRDFRKYSEEEELELIIYERNGDVWLIGETELEEQIDADLSYVKSLE